eukprot:gene48145-57454_t
MRAWRVVAAAAAAVPSLGSSCAPPGCNVTLGRTPVGPLTVHVEVNDTCVAVRSAQLGLPSALCMSPAASACAREQTPATHATPRMADASGLKLGGGGVGFMERLLQPLVGHTFEGGIVASYSWRWPNRFAPIELGNAEGCRAVSGDARYCLWHVDGGFQRKKVVLGTCRGVLQFQAAVYRAFADAASKAVGGRVGEAAWRVEKGAHGASLFASDDVEIHCTGPLSDASPTTLPDRFAQDRAAQAWAAAATAAVLCTLAALTVAATVAAACRRVGAEHDAPSEQQEDGLTDSCPSTRAA